MKNSKLLLSLAAVGGLLGSTSEASAGKLDFDRDSFFVVSADRTFGFSYAQDKSETTQGSTTITSTRKSTDVSLLIPNGGSPYNVPQFSLHYSVIPALTLGAGLGFRRSSGEATIEGGGQSTTVEGTPVTTFVIAPRVGYIFGFSNAFYLWARAGITYYNTSSESKDAKTNSTTKSSDSGLALSVEPMFVFTPVNRLGISFGPVLDLGLTGKDKNETTSGGTTTTVETDHKTTGFGLQIGLLGYI